MDATEVKTYELQLRDYVVAALVDADFKSPNVHAYMQYKLEHLAYIMVASFRVPCKVLQDERVVADYPDGLWQHIKKKLGLIYRHKIVRLNETLVFPNIELPPSPLGDKIRLHVADQVSTEFYR